MLCQTERASEKRVHFCVSLLQPRRNSHVFFLTLMHHLWIKFPPCWIRCRSSRHARQIVAWQCASIVGGYVLVLSDWVPTNPPPPSPSGAEEGGGEGVGGGGLGREILDMARRLVNEGVHAVLAEPLQVCVCVRVIVYACVPVSVAACAFACAYVCMSRCIHRCKKRVR